MKITAVAFDMDGLLFDTERLVQEAWDVVGRTLGYENLGAFNYKTLGLNRVACRALFLAHYGADFPYEQLQEGEHRYIQQAIKERGMPVKTGVRELLAFLKAEGYLMAVATSTYTDIAKKYLADTALLPYFVDVIGGDQVTESKPNPEIYLKACTAMGVDPTCCLALEDSFNGIRAAHAGGLIPVMVPDLAEPDAEMKEKAVACVSSLLEVIPFLQQGAKEETL